MAITVEQRWTTGTQSADPNGAGAALEYLVSGTDDLEAATTGLNAAVSPSFAGVPISSVGITERIADQIWAGEATYGKFPAKSTGDSEFSFAIATQNVKVVQSKQTIPHAAAGQAAPPFGGGIGFQGERFEGADVLVPIYSFSETHYLSSALITDSYKATVFNTAGKTNTSAFRGFAAGELLFVGASGSARVSQNDWQVRFSFIASPNAVLTVGDIANISKPGWWFLWVLYEELEDQASKFLVQKPKAAYVERVYDAANFALLGI